MKTGISSDNNSIIYRVRAKYRRYMVFIAFLGAVISDIDRINFGVATPTLMKGFGLRTKRINVRKAVFYRSYTIMMIPACTRAPGGRSVHDSLVVPE